MCMAGQATHQLRVTPVVQQGQHGGVPVILCCQVYGGGSILGPEGGIGPGPEQGGDTGRVALLAGHGQGVEPMISRLSTVAPSWRRVSSIARWPYSAALFRADW